MGVDAEDDAVAVLEMAAHPLDLVRINVGCVHLNRRGQVEDHGLFLCGLPDILDGRADVQSEIKLGSGKALRGILQHKVAVVVLRALFDPAGSVLRDLDDPLAVHVEDDVSLQGRGGVVNVEDDVLAALDGLECPVDLLLPALGEDLDVDIIRNHIVVDQFAEKIIFDLAGSGETDLDLLEAELQKKTVHLHFFADDHGVDQGLVAVSEVDAAPDGRLLDLLVRPLPLGV